MKGSGLIILEMVLEFINGRMEPDMKVIGRIIRLMAKANFTI